MDGITLIGTHRVLFVMAAKAEYGPALQSRITPLMTGIGPVEAACATATTLARLDAAGALPDLVVSLGSAGSARLEQARVYQIGAVGWRDMDASAFGFPRGVVPFLDLPEMLPITLRIEGLPVASLSTGANVVSGAGYGAIAQDMVDMESYAVLRACQRFGLPMIGLRGVSDGVGEVTQISDWTEYLHIIDERLAGAVDLLAAALAKGLLR
ncbi:MAG: 5'-methylthioadenosine/S-adenosylhomocysteine nucleosidase [Paracoccus sp. (in: a-proteobacteria)]|nr:5'-methylthioadenosine/S-adenosylhomocysteine nucleosidase [Paracoccus sp. (in: a-proteobacteria)]